MKFRKIGFTLFVFLVFYWIAAIFLIIFSIGLGVALFYYFKNENAFYFDWVKEAVYAIQKAIPGGGVLGTGIWIKAKLEGKR